MVIKSFKQVYLTRPFRKMNYSRMTDVPKIRNYDRIKKIQEIFSNNKRNRSKWANHLKLLTRLSIWLSNVIVWYNLYRERLKYWSLIEKIVKGVKWIIIDGIVRETIKTSARQII